MSASLFLEAVCAAADLWQKLTGISPDARSLSLGQWGERGAHEEVGDSLRFDETGFTTYMLLRGHVTAYVARQTVSAADLIRGLSAEQETRLGLMRQIVTILDDERLRGPVAEFTENLRQAGRHYGAGDEKIGAILADPLMVATLRRDALRSYRERLTTHQFGWAADAPASEGAANHDVFEFWNMASLVGALEVQRHPGVTMCLVRDPSAPLHSFFAVAISNGGTMTVLTDRSEDPHPDFKHMTRRPDRALDKRQSRNWFPYELLDLKEQAGRVFATERTGLVPVNVAGVPIARIADLEPQAVLWWAMLLDLIRADYFRRNKRLDAQSFTADRIVVAPLLGETGRALVSVDPRALVVPRLDHARVTAATTAEQWQVKPRGVNEWMMARYAHEVPVEALNVVGADPARTLLGPDSPVAGFLPPPDGVKDLRPFWEVREAPAKAGEIVKQRGGSRGDAALARMAAAGRLRALDGVAFGSAADLERDRLWAARVNQAAIVNSMAHDEYRETRDEILVIDPRFQIGPKGWFADQVQRCRSSILDIAAQGEFMAPAKWLPVRMIDGKMWSAISIGAGGQSYPEHKECEANIVKVRIGERPKFWWSGGINLSIRYQNGGQWACPVTGSKALAYHAEFMLQDGRSVAKLFGIPFDDLPWQVKVWTNSPERGSGNAILERLDPSDWMMSNPWVANGARGDGLDLTIRVSFSKRGINRLRKALGLPKVEWPQGD